MNTETLEKAKSLKAKADLYNGLVKHTEGKLEEMANDVNWGAQNLRTSLNALLEGMTTRDELSAIATLAIWFARTRANRATLEFEQL